eukprot:263306_1
MDRKMLTGTILNNLLIFANCIFALQGFIVAMVYFALQRMGNPSEEYLQRTSVVTSAPRSGRDLTVSDIRCNAKRKSENKDGLHETAVADGDKDLVATLNFDIFDGTPDPDSPWAR